MGKLNWVMKACGVLMLLATTAVALPAQNFTTLYNFGSTGGWGPYAGLVQGADGNFYGTTLLGGGDNFCIFGCGTIFRITLEGAVTTLHEFCSEGGNGCPDGGEAFAGLVLGANGDLYGITDTGGNTSTYCQGGGYCGTVFKITPGGVFTTLHTFDGTDGGNSEAALIQAADGNFYGTTQSGGKNGSGTVFKMTPNGTLTTLYSFCSHPRCTDGAGPFAPLVQGTDGDFYGTTLGGGGSENAGTVFRITPTGVLTTLHIFCSQENCTDGRMPMAGLVQGPDGGFYGSTDSGGSGDHFYSTIFRITPRGTLTTLQKLGGLNGNSLVAAMVLGIDGNFYGTTLYGGDISCYYGPETGCGVIFEMAPDGAIRALHNFDGTDGADPWAGLIQDTNGFFYGTTSGGGLNKCGDGGYCGTVFSLSVGLGPFVETNPAAGKVGAAVGILGTDLTGATGVKFNGTETAFRVVSSTFIEAKVPSGATTGKVTVQLPGGTLSSNVPFIVLR